jgi:isoquinoline 1-oxidoreductase beta subunit
VILPNRIEDKEERSQEILNVSRRWFLQGAGGLTLGVFLAPGLSKFASAEAACFTPNAFVRIGTDNVVTVIAKNLEMGQGVYTGFATLVAEELDADWSQVKVEGAPADMKRYSNQILGGLQGTGGSTSIASSYEQMRQAGASAKAMLMTAAAARWSVPPDSLTVRRGVVSHSLSGRSATFGELAEDASKQPVPQNVKLKDARDFDLIGKAQLGRKDSAAKVNGTATFTQDLKLPGMLVAVVAHPKQFGATVKSFDATKAKSVPGVVEVVQFDAVSAHGFPGVAVLAKNTWAARQGRDALVVHWDESKAFKLGSDEILAQYKEAANKEGSIARKEGDIAAAFAGPVKQIEAEYEFPYLAHAPMEPLNCVVKLSAGHCEIWNGEQFQTFDQGAAARLLGIPPANVSITQLYAGGSFGRRANPQSDYVMEAVAIAKGARDKGLDAPIKMVWTREEDIRGGYYRALFYHRGRIAVDGNGHLVAWHQRIVGQSIMKNTALEAMMVRNGIDGTSVEGAADLPYDIPNLQVELHTPEDIEVPVQWWRSVGHSHTAYATECLIDEAAAAAGKDPYEFRHALLSKSPRLKSVLELAAEKAGWGQPLKQGVKGEKRGRGIAVHYSFNTYVAQVAEVTIKPDGALKVDRVVCAVDCGVAVNPDVIKAQMEGSIGFGLAAAMHGAITLKDGVVEQSNFHQFRVLRISEMPTVEVHIVRSTEKPTGVGEPGVPPIAPAVANAIFAATGRRIRTLPIAKQLEKA